MTDAEIRDKAVMRYASGDIEIDQEPVISRGDTGAWVRAWVYVSFEEDDA